MEGLGEQIRAYKHATKKLDLWNPARHRICSTPSSNSKQHSKKKLSPKIDEDLILAIAKVLNHKDVLLCH